VQDAAAFEAFYAAHRRHVVAYCLRRASRADAHEAADETLLIAWRRFDDIPEGQERAWLYGVAYRVLANQHRGERRRRRLGARLAHVRSDPSPDPEADVVRSEEHERLRAALLRLRPADQEVLRLATWEELPHDQLGVALDCEPDAARQRLRRARERLANDLERADRRTFALARWRSDD
jgi:RNA polymerase sigma factor (sigma-70 family)